MKKFFKMIVINVFSLWIIDMLFHDIHFANMTTVMMTAIILGLLNSTLKPFLKFISLPLSILTLGLFSLLINGFVFFLALHIGGGYVGNVLTAVLASIVLSIANSVFSSWLD